MHVKLGQPPGRDRPHQVGMAVKVEVLAGQQAIDVGIAAGSQQVMHTPAFGVLTVACQSVVDDGGHGTQKGQRRPQPVVGADMGPLQLTGARGPHALARVMAMPHVEVTDLGAIDDGDAKDLPRLDLPCQPITNRYPVTGHPPPTPRPFGQAVIEGAIHVEH